MPNEIKWRAPVELTSGIANQSINQAAGFLGSEINNRTGLDIWVDLTLVFTAASAPIAGRTYEVYDLYNVEFTGDLGYEDGSATIQPLKKPIAVFPARAVATAQRITQKRLLVAPYKLQFLAWNSLGVNSTGVTLHVTQSNRNIEDT